MADEDTPEQPAPPVYVPPPAPTTINPDPAPPLDLPPIDTTPFQPNPAEPDWTFEQLKSRAINAFNLIAQQAGSDFLVSYPDLEKLTWPQQVAEAIRWRADPNSGPFVVCEAINARRGLDFPTFMAKTAGKVEAFQRVAGLIIGERQRLEDAVGALEEDTLENRTTLSGLAWTVTQQDIENALSGQ